MRIVCVGGGPAGLYFAILMKRRDPAHRITVVERNRPYDTFGWGVVFSDQTLATCEAPTRRASSDILDSFAHWDDIDIHFKGRVITSRRPRLLRHRAQAPARTSCRSARRSLGVELVFRARGRRRRASSPTPI